MTIPWASETGCIYDFDQEHFSRSEYLPDSVSNSSCNANIKDIKRPRKANTIEAEVSE